MLYELGEFWNLWLSAFARVLQVKYVQIHSLSPAPSFPPSQSLSHVMVSIPDSENSTHKGKEFRGFLPPTLTGGGDNLLKLMNSDI